MKHWIFIGILLIKTDAVSDFKHRRVLLPDQQKDFKIFEDLPSMYDVQVLNYLPTYTGTPSSVRADVNIYMLLCIKDVIIDSIKNADFAKKYSMSRFSELLLFFTAIDITSKYANTILNRIPTHDVYMSMEELLVLIFQNEEEV